MATIVLFACQPSQNTGEVKGGYGDPTSKKDRAMKAHKSAFMECVGSITQNQKHTLRETHDDPNCELTEANCINMSYLDDEGVFTVFKFRQIEGKDYHAARVDVKDDSVVYQSFIFSDIKACKCMKEQNMTIGFGENTGVVRIGLGDLTDKSGSGSGSSASDRYSFGGTGDYVRQLLVELLPDIEGVPPPTYHYCRLKITAYNLGSYSKYRFLNDDGSIKPQDDAKFMGGLWLTPHSNNKTTPMASPAESPPPHRRTH